MSNGKVIFPEWLPDKWKEALSKISQDLSLAVGQTLLEDGLNSKEAYITVEVYPEKEILVFSIRVEARIKKEGGESG